MPSVNEAEMPRCPVCKKPLRISNCYWGDPFYECWNEDCEIMGMEGFEWNWEALTRLLTNTPVRETGEE